MLSEYREVFLEELGEQLQLMDRHTGLSDTGRQGCVSVERPEHPMNLVLRELLAKSVGNNFVRERFLNEYFFQ